MPATLAPDIDHALAALPAALRQAATLWWEHLQDAHGTTTDLLREAGVDPLRLLQLVAISEFAGRELLRRPQPFLDAAANGVLESAPQPDWRELRQDAEPAQFMQQLRVLRNRVLVQILWRKLHGGADLTETLSSLSALADNLIAASHGYARRRLVERCGEVRDPDGRPVPLVILAMGKLGGKELNFSSDVDLIFLYPRDGESDGARCLSAQEYFSRLSRRIISLLEESTSDGFVYRVDTRLRPFGDSGPPVVSFAALESYLLNHGRNWERYAYIKSRAIVPAGRDTAVEALRQELIEPFVYRRYLDYGVFESLREMKAMISAEVERREMAGNVKLGPGGIREIEFIVQSMQLVRGGTVRALRTRELRVALRELHEHHGMSHEAAQGLLESYGFLRRLENFLQAIRDQQVHDLPDDATDRARLALAMGCADWSELAQQTARQRDFVSAQFAAIAFRGSGNTHLPELSAEIAALSAVSDDPGDWQALFAGHGFAEAGELAAEMQQFQQAKSTRQADATARRRLQQLLPALLSRLRDRPRPAETLRRALKIVTQVLRRSAYVALLNENTAVLERLLDLCEQSAWLADEVARFPLLLDEMLDPRLLTGVHSAASLREELEGRLASLGDTDSERRVEVLAQFQRAALFRIAAADFGGDMPVMKVSDRLTDVAEIVLGEALEIAWRDLAERFGEPRFDDDGVNRAAGLGVIAYGKLGGIELSYGSDLDLVFLHNSRGREQQTNGARPLDNGMYFVRLARRLVHFLTTQTGSGALYDVDTRLRPSGRAGLLVTSVEAFERYQRENAWTWEHQALLRARPVAGHAGVAREFERVRADTLTHRVNRDTLQADVGAMREKMRATLDQSDAARFDLKQGSGGIGDIEFLVQYLVLRNAREHPAVIHYPDNIRQLGTLGAAACLGRDDVERLQDVYRLYRTRLHRRLLDGRSSLVPAGEFAEERRWIGRLWERHLG